ncbi:MAG: cysteine desulfurase [Elusimicrobia bacterium]|nr:cysteine desulfurase [Candidatus Obscuribacterium magneticum]
MNQLDPHKIRKDFPILSRTMNGKPLVYLDNAATTQKPNAVIKALADFYRETNANIHRGAYPLAEEATTLYEETRSKVGRFINAASPESLIFTRNTTESINLVAHSWARKFLKEGDEILLTALEHHANIVPWYLLSKEKGIKLKSVPVKDDSTLDMEAFKRFLTPRVKLVAVTGMSNVLGTLTPLEDIIRTAHQNRSLVLVDGAQSVPHLPTDVTQLDVDFLAFSAHKMLGPTGVGVLWVKPEILDTMDPFLGGGEMISTVSLEKITWADPPFKFEAGTPNYADVAVFAVAVDYLEKLGMDAVRDHEKEILHYALSRLSELHDYVIYGPKDPEKQSGAISFNHKTIHAHDVGTILGLDGVAIRVGHHCAQPLMVTLGVPATARASFYIYNTKEDVDALITALKKVNQVFGLTRSRV